MKQYDPNQSIELVVGYSLALELGLTFRSLEDELKLPPPNMPGAERRRCQKCTRYVWLARSSQQILREHPEARLLCIECAKPVAADHADVFEPVRATDHQLRRDFGATDPEAAKIGNPATDSEWDLLMSSLFGQKRE